MTADITDGADKRRRRCPPLLSPRPRTEPQLRLSGAWLATLRSVIRLVSSFSPRLSGLNRPRFTEQVPLDSAAGQLRNFLLISPLGGCDLLIREGIQMHPIHLYSLFTLTHTFFFLPSFFFFFKDTHFLSLFPQRNSPTQTLHASYLTSDLNLPAALPFKHVTLRSENDRHTEPSPQRRFSLGPYWNSCASPST